MVSGVRENNMSTQIFDWEKFRNNFSRKDVVREFVIRKSFNQFLDGNPDLKQYIEDSVSSTVSSEMYEFFRRGFLIRDALDE